MNPGLNRDFDRACGGPFSPLGRVFSRGRPPKKSLSDAYRIRADPPATGCRRPEKVAAHARRRWVRDREVGVSPIRFNPRRTPVSPVKCMSFLGLAALLLSP